MSLTESLDTTLKQNELVFIKGSGQSSTTLSEEQSKSQPPDPAKDPVGRFRYEVITTWLPKCDGEGFNAVEWFLEAESAGIVKCRIVTQEELQALEDSDLLRWKESRLFSQVLESIKLPLDPAHPFSNPCEGPVMFVRDPSHGNAVIVVNGNHRTGAVLYSEYNSENHALYVLELATPECFEKLAGVPLSATRYLGIEIYDGPRSSRS